MLEVCIAPPYQLIVESSDRHQLKDHDVCDIPTQSLFLAVKSDSVIKQEIKIPQFLSARFWTGELGKVLVGLAMIEV